MTVLLPAAIGFIPDAGLKRDRNSHAAAPKIQLALAFTRTGPGPGRRTAAFSTTARPATRRENPGIRNGNRSGGMSRQTSGPEMTYRISRQTHPPKNTWDHSS